MGGWKTWLGMGLVALGSAIKVFTPIVPELGMASELIIGIGVAIGGIGIAHKIEKSK